MDNRLYLSVLTVAASAGSLGFELSTLNTSPAFTIVGSVTGITTSDTEKSIAKKILDQTSIIVAQHGATYQGVALSLQDTPVTKYQISRTDHCVCYFSQALFTLSITSNTTGAIVRSNPSPTLITVADARTYGSIMGQAFTGLSDSQVATLVSLISADLVSELENNIVISTYVVDTWTNMINGFRLPAYPVVEMDSPWITKPFYIYWLTEVAFSDRTQQYVIQPDGWIMYRYPQDILFTWSDPFDMNGQWRVSWMAGENTIPESVKIAILKLAPFFMTSGSSSSTIEELAGGTSRVKYADATKEKLIIYRSLSGLMR